MMDIIELEDEQDMSVEDSSVPKSGNILSTQLGSLEYAQEFGADLKFFLQTDFQFQNESFKSYLIQRLTDHQIDLSQVADVIEALYEKHTFYVKSKQETGGLIL